MVCNLTTYTAISILEGKGRGGTSCVQKARSCISLPCSCSAYNMYVWKRVDISAVIICYASDIIEYGRRTPEI